MPIKRKKKPVLIPGSPLSADDVRAIREIYATGNPFHNQAWLAEQYGCSQTTVHKIVTRRVHADII